MNKFKSLTLEKLYPIFTALILLVCLFLRLWQLETLPYGINLDEAGTAYDAWCLANYGVDRYLISWPVYLNNFGGGQSILYAYLLAGLIKMFGFHVWTIRMPSVIFSLLATIFGMKIARKLYPGEYLPALATGILMTICPCLVLIGRLGLDCFLTLGVSTLFLYCFISALESERNAWYVLSGIAGGILLYSYILNYVILPIFLLISLLLVLRWKKFSFRKWLAMAIPMGLLAFPLILTQLINLFGWDSIQIGPFTCPHLMSYRSYEFTGFQLSSLTQMITYTFWYGSFEFVSVPDFPNFYFLTIPLFLIGLGSGFYRIFKTLKTGKADFHTFIYLWFFLVFFLFCFVVPNAYRIIGIFFAVVLITVEGFHCILRLIRQKKKAHTFSMQAALTLVVGCIYGVSFLHFCHYYYLGHYTAEHYPLTLFSTTFAEAVDYIEAHPEIRHRETQLAEYPIYLAISALDSPYDLGYNASSLYLADGYWHCSCLGEIMDDVNYIVDITQGKFGEYVQELRDAGFTEVNFGDHSLFFKE